ncbi:LysM peptidoglycan-binding domain-containing protein [Flavobacterium sp.]|jgi:LysM repeat protein|uniref:LysM peptidoglycan-binding domain-containing protein n=1 Tax=Flavobacterium sp. TaxID=239 RepID=UPI0037C1A9AA
MNLSKLLTFILFFLSASLFSQKNTKHTVVEGESIYVIAKKYGVSESDIYELNPKAKGALLQLKTVLLIPNKSKKTTISDQKKKKTTSKNIESTEIHTAVAGESLYVIAKKYGISLEKIKEINPTLNPDAIQIGDKINIIPTKKTITEKKNKVPSKVEKPVATITTPTPVVNTSVVSVPVATTPMVCEDELGNTIHTVQKGETLYRIAKLYNVKLKLLKELNEEVVENLPEGYLLIVKLGNLEIAKHQNTLMEKPVLVPISLENMSKAEFLIAKASEHLGTRYRGGGTTSAGFDCSGLMFSTFKNIDMTLPRSSGSMAVGAGVKIEREQAQKGDLIFFTTNGRGSINHVGMITEIIGDEIKFIHSSVQSGVVISSTKEPYYAKRFIQINRVLE